MEIEKLMEIGMEMGKKAVLIDFDGTLANTNEVIVRSFQHTYRTFFGEERPRREIEANFGEPLRTSMLRQFGEEYQEEAVNVYRSFQSDRFAKLIEVFPGMDKLVKNLKKAGYMTALVTSRVKDSAMEGINKFGLSEDFDVITTINDITRHKPDPEAIEVTLKKLGIGVEDAVMVGDSKFDILCARNAGCRTVLVDWSVAGEEERIGFNADFIGKTAEDIYDWIKENL